MAYALIGSGVSKAGSGNSASYDTTGATLLVLMLSAQTISAGPADSKGNTWTLIGSVLTQVGSFGMQTGLYYVSGTPSVGSGHTFSCADSVPALEVLAFSGGATSSQLDQHTATADQADTAAIKPGSITPSAANQVVLFGCGGFDSGGGTVDSSFIKQLEVFGAGGTNYSGMLSYLIQTTATAENPGYTITSASGRTWGAHMASFNAGSGGGGGGAVGMPWVMPMLGVQ